MSVIYPEPCEICGLDDDEPRQLLCDDCDKAFHMYCLEEPIFATPKDEEWHCPKCSMTRILESKCKCGAKVLSFACILKPDFDWKTGKLEISDNCNTCGERVTPILNPEKGFWEYVSGREETYPDSKEQEAHKEMINFKTASVIAIMDPSREYPILVIDGEYCHTSKALSDRGYKKDQLICVNNCVSSLKIKESGLNTTFPLDVQDYLSGRYSRIFPLRKFGGVLLDLCGGINQLTTCKIFENLRDEGVLLVTLCKRGDKDTRSKAKKWLGKEAKKNGYGLKKILDIEYNQEGHQAMFTAVFQFHKENEASNHVADAVDDDRDQGSETDASSESEQEVRSEKKSKKRERENENERDERKVESRGRPKKWGKIPGELSEDVDIDKIPAPEEAKETPIPGNGNWITKIFGYDSKKDVFSIRWRKKENGVRYATAPGDAVRKHCPMAIARSKAQEKSSQAEKTNKRQKST